MKAGLLCLPVLLLLTEIPRATACDYATIEGKEFVFAEQPENLRHYGYQLWQKTPEPPGKIPYEDYVGKKGKFTGNISTSSTGIFKTYEVVMEDCGKLYVPTLDRPVEQLGMLRGIIFLSDLKDTQSLVGKTIYLNKAANAAAVVRSEADGTPIKFDQAAPCVVESVKKAITPSLVVRFSKTGARGIIRYDKSYIWLKNPINQKWGIRIISLIREQKVAIGMTPDQVRLSWGEPKHINELLGRWGNHQQWVYDLSQYVYIENGRVSSLQVSR